MRGFIRFCIKRPVFTWCGVILFLVLGVSSYFELGVTLYPNVEIPFVMVQTIYMGASPNEIEQLVSKPLEDALADLEGLDAITSYSQDGISIVLIQLTTDTDPNIALIDVGNKVKAKRASLPSDVEEPVTLKFDINAIPFMIASFTSDLPEKETKKYVDDRIKPIASRISGVGQVEVAGGKDREIHVILDPVALSEYKVTYLQICAVIAANNLTFPSGYITQEKDQISLRLAGEFNDVEQLENIMIPTSTGSPIPLSLLGRVVDGEADVRSIARANNSNIVQLRISPMPNSDVVKAGKELKLEIDKAVSELDWLEVAYTYDDTEFIETSVKNVLRDTAIGILLTAIVIYLFLGRLSATFIVAISMPVAFMATFVPMQVHNFTQNLMSTLGLALSMGTLVMNSILIIQNIYRYRDMGYEPFEAAEEGAVEISISVLAGVLTNLGVFLPVALMSSISGQFLAPYAVTILYATIFSLWVTMSVTPCMAARIGKSGDISFMAKILTGWWEWLYEGFHDLFMFILKRAMRHPLITIICAFGLMYGAVVLTGLVGMDFMPITDDGTVTINLTLSNNASITETERKTSLVEKFVESMPEKEFMRDIVTTIGASMRSSSLNKSEIAIYLKEDPKRPSTQYVADKIRVFLETLEGVEFAIFDTRRGFGDPIEIRIKGDDMSVLYALAEEIRAKGNRLPGIRDMTIQTEMGKPELQIEPIRWRLSQIGFNISDLSSIVRGYLIGNVAGKFRQDGFEYDIKAMLERQKAGDIYSVPDLPIMTQYGLVPLKEMAEVRWHDSPTEIRRVDRERTVVVTGNVIYISAGEGNAKLQELVNTLSIPDGCSVEFGGSAKMMNEEFAELFKAMAIAVLITFIIVAAIMESWAYSFIILLTVPMALIGIIPSMLVSGISISLFALIGMIMLIGMVVNNAIVVLDYAEVLRRNGKTPEEAIEEASDTRFKSLVMAVVTSVVSLIPLAISGGRGSEMRSPIAIVAIGGLVAGGLLALLVIPAAYKVYWALARKISEFRVKKVHTQTDEMTA